MLTLYFSGTGNTKFIAELFSAKMNAACHSIEETLDFTALIAEYEIIALCYPIYGSRVPRLMREFTASVRHALTGKKLIIFCTQWMFSGDGARAFTDLFESPPTVIYAEHFNMPNNVCNVPLLPVSDAKGQAKYRRRAERKMTDVCNNIRNGVVKRRGFNIISRSLGLMQGVPFPKMEAKAANDVRIGADCIGCGVCVSLCPTANLTLTDGKIGQNGNCTLCYRCVNKCPKMAITVFTHGKVRRQYGGMRALETHICV